MLKRITVQAIHRQEPDVRTFILALLELARDTSAQATGNEPADGQRPAEASDIE
jgi:hypothetical protein